MRTCKTNGYRVSVKTAILTASLVLAGCGGDSSSDKSSDKVVDKAPEAEQPALGTETLAEMDASGATGQAVYFDLTSGHITSVDQTWHFAYQKYTGFKTNSGVSGSGNLSVCVAHAYDDLYDADGNPVLAAFQQLTAESTFSDYDAVNKQSCSEEDFVTDAVNTQIDDWLKASFDPAVGPVLSASEDSSNGWILRSASKDDAGAFSYGRVKVNRVDYDSAAAKKVVYYSSEAWDKNSQTFKPAVESPAIDFSSEKKYWDMETNTIVTASDDWELSIVAEGRDWLTQVNATVSGTGSAGVGLISGKGMQSAFDVTDPTDSSQVYAYFHDSASGAMSTPGSYGPLEYGVAGGHAMWVTFTTYLFKDSDSGRYFKAQVISNYGADQNLGSGNLIIRYEEVID